MSTFFLSELYWIIDQAYRLSREEREAAYNKARERIFGNPEKAGDATPGKNSIC